MIRFKPIRRSLRFDSRILSVSCRSRSSAMAMNSRTARSKGVSPKVVTGGDGRRSRLASEKSANPIVNLPSMVNLTRSMCVWTLALRSGVDNEPSRNSTKLASPMSR
ncbi:hypothetical protein PROPHIGD12-2_42 [Mycobacterium phage prophiGD12-2]|nr:hypothetical protein PROPHIGD12-2_42 [Mycobacterium phage prophiGD12-2]